MKFKYQSEKQETFPLIGVITPGTEIETENKEIIKLLLSNDRFFTIEKTSKIKQETEETE